MPNNLTLEANKIVYILISVILFLGGFILKDFLSNSKFCPTVKALHGNKTKYQRNWQR